MGYCVRCPVHPPPTPTPQSGAGPFIFQSDSGKRAGATPLLGSVDQVANGSASRDFGVFLALGPTYFYFGRRQVGAPVFPWHVSGPQWPHASGNVEQRSWHTTCYQVVRSRRCVPLW